jgi:hypothetical protein
MSDTPAQSPMATPVRRPNRGVVTTLLVAAAFVGILASFAVWSARQLLDTDQWTSTSSQLLEDQDIREAVGATLVDGLFENVDIQSEIAGALPPRFAPLAGPATGALRTLADQRAPILLARPRVQALWEQLNRDAHERFLAVVNGDAPAVSQTGDEVYLDLGEIVQEVGSQLGITAAAKIPEGVVRLNVMSADDLEMAQDGIRLGRAAAYVLAALMLLLLGSAVWFARGWRRVAIRSCGVVLIAIGVVVLVAQSLTGDFIVDALSSTAAGVPAAESTWRIATSLLGDLGVAMIGYGVVVLVGAWLAGPGAAGSSLRRGITPFIRDRRTLYPTLFLIVLLVVAWSPTEGTRRLIPSLVLIVLLIAGAEALRRQAIHDFPDATMETWSHGWRERFDAIRRRARTGLPERHESTISDDRVSQLERIAALHQAGVLSDEELAEEKALIRASPV